MAAPNIVNVATITAKTDTALLSSTAATNALNNPASSGKVMKVNSLVISNVDASASATITIGIYPQDDIGGTAVVYANAVSVAPNSFLIAIDKDVGMYLEEDTSLGVTASVANDLTYTITYEELS
jgi:hypothetical protein|tara:strand:- start:1682 stop:2056 length:375 start_codon:yes stop_codon:yes gene_type:complete